MAPSLTKFIRLFVYSHHDPIQFVYQKIAKLSKAERLAILDSYIIAEQKIIKLNFSKIHQEYQLNKSLDRLNYLIEYSTDFTIDMATEMRGITDCQTSLVALLELAKSSKRLIRITLDSSLFAITQVVLDTLEKQVTPVESIKMVSSINNHYAKAVPHQILTVTKQFSL